MVALLSLDLQRLHQRHLLLCGELCAVQLLAYLFRLLPEALGILLRTGLGPTHLCHAQLQALGLGTHFQLPLPLRLQRALEALRLLGQLLLHLLLILLQLPRLSLRELFLLLQQLSLGLEPRGLLHRLHLLLEHLLRQRPLPCQVFLRQLTQPGCLLGCHAEPRRLLRHLLHLLGLLLQDALCVVLVAQHECAVLCLDARLELAELVHLHAHREELLLHAAALAGGLGHLSLEPLQLLIQDALLVVGFLQLQSQRSQLLLHLRLLPQSLLCEPLVLVHLGIGRLLLPQGRLLRLRPPRCLLLRLLAQLLRGLLRLCTRLRLCLGLLLQPLGLFHLPPGLRRLALRTLPRRFRLLGRAPRRLRLSAQAPQHTLLLLARLLQFLFLLLHRERVRLLLRLQPPLCGVLGQLQLPRGLLLCLFTQAPRLIHLGPQPLHLLQRRLALPGGLLLCS